MNNTKVMNTRRMTAMSKPVRKMAAKFIKPKTSLKISSILDEPIPDSFNTPILQTPDVQPPAAVRRSLRSRMSYFMSSIDKQFKKFNDWIGSVIPEPVKKTVSEKTRSLKERIYKIYKTTVPTEVENAFKGKVKTFRIKGDSTMDYKTFLRLNKMPTVTLLNNQAKPIKIRLLLYCQFYKVVDGEKIFTDSHFSTKNEVITESTDLSEIYNIANERLTELLENFQRNGSGWIFDKVLHFEIMTNEFRPLRGSSYIKLPKSLANKRAIINPKNEDNECFKWCVTEAVYPQSKNRGRITKKSKENAELFNWSETKFPMNLKKISLFEENNPNYAVNVLGYEEKKTGIFPLRISKFSSTRTVVNLLMISEDESLKQHYVIIQDLSRLVCNQVDHHNGKTHICLNCMNPFHSEEKLKSHKEHCDNHDAVKIVVPDGNKENSKLDISFEKHNRKLKVPFVIYADFESFTEKIEQREDCKANEQLSYTRKYQKHTPCGFLQRWTVQKACRVLRRQRAK